MDLLRARLIAQRLHEKWVMDPKDDGGYVLQLSAEETEEFFKDITQEIQMAGD